MNNPLKYTDPSGYTYVPRDYEGEDMYMFMQNMTGRIMDMSYGLTSFGGGGFSSGLGGYTHFNGQYYYEGQPVPEVEARLFAIEPNSSMSISYLEARYFMIDKSTAWATFYYEKSSGNGKSIIDYLQNQEVDPKRINPYNGPVVDQILDWMEYIYQNSPNDLFLPQVVSSSLFKNPFNGEPSNLSKKEGNIKYFITNPLTSTVYYERWPIVEVIYNPNENSISIFLQATDTRQYRGSRVIYIQSNDADLIWDYWENIKN